MALITWDNTLSVGIEEIDAQHREWIDIMNALHEELGCGDPQRLQRIKDKSFDAMIAYANDHFRFEEEFMRKMNYPGLQAHKREHARFKDQLLTMQYEMTRGFQPLNTQLMSIMKNWLQEHILSEDRKIGLYAADPVDSDETAPRPKSG